MTGVPRRPGPCPSCCGALSVSWAEATGRRAPGGRQWRGPACLRPPPTLQTHYEQYHGFVILHGTDTMAFAASVLAFVLENLQKTVILTGSQVTSQACGARPVHQAFLRPQLSPQPPPPLLLLCLCRRAGRRWSAPWACPVPALPSGGGGGGSAAHSQPCRAALPLSLSPFFPRWFPLMPSLGTWALPAPSSRPDPAPLQSQSRWNVLENHWICGGQQEKSGPCQGLHQRLTWGPHCLCWHGKGNCRSVNPSGHQGQHPTCPLGSFPGG